MSMRTAFILGTAIAVCAGAVAIGLRPGVGLAQDTQPPAANSMPADCPAYLAAGGGTVALDLQVDQAVRNGLDYIYAHQASSGAWETRYSQQFPCGAESLVVLAALSAGDKPTAPAVKAALDYLDRVQPGTVYARALRTMVYSRLDGPDNARRLKSDVAWLIDQQKSNGGWGYGADHPTTKYRRDWTDNSNTQLAQLALSHARQAGAVIPAAVWRRCRTYWLKGQNADGGWGYDPPQAGNVQLRPESYGTMTAAGAASLMLADAELAGEDAASPNGRAGPAEPSPDARQLAKALGWLRENYSVQTIPKQPSGLGESSSYYYLHCLQRALDFNGMHSLGPTPWAREMAQFILSRQIGQQYWLDGSSRGPTEDVRDAVVPTAFAVLVLSTCRQNVTINKLALNAGDHLDARNLARWLGRTAGWGGNWQLVTEDDLKDTISQAPLLLISGDSKSALSAACDEPLARFLADGGTVIVQPAGGDAAFARRMQEHFLKLLPQCAAAKLSGEHPVFGLGFNIRQNDRPPIVGIGDAGRTRVFILQSDVSGYWHANQFRTAAWAFELAGNMLQYGTNSAKPRPRFAEATPVVAPAAEKLITVARLRHAGDWDTNPRAMEALSRSLTLALGVGIKQVPAVDLKAGVPKDVSVLWLTGSSFPTFSDKQKAKLAGYLQGGGTVFIDSAYGRPGFVQDASEFLKGVFGQSGLSRLTGSHELLSGEFADGMGSDIRRVRFTPALAREQADNREPALWGVQRDGRAAVILSGFGVTGQLDGVSTYGSKGLEPRDALRLAGNVVLYAASRGDRK